MKDFFLNIKYNLRDIKYKISEFFFPRQRWLTKKIPKTWVDKDTLLDIVILESIKHYVEKEDCLNVLATIPSENDVLDCSAQYRFLSEVKENYRLITKVLPELEKEQENEWAKIPPTDLDNLQNELNNPKQTYEQKYGKLNELERKINDLKTEIMIWAVKNRAQMWT